MTILRISSVSTNGTSVTLGSHAKGDTIVYIAYNEASATIPTLPANVLGLYTRSASGGSQRFGFYIADSSSESVGTTGWTNADNVTAIVYRGGSSSIVVPTFLSVGSATSATSRNTSNNLASNSPTGMTNVNNSVGTGFEVATYDTNATRTTIWPSTNVTLANSAAYFAFVFELLEIDTKIASGGGFRPVNIRGGADQ